MADNTKFLDMMKIFQYGEEGDKLSWIRLKTCIINKWREARF